jgi:hypothetical protein
MANRERGEVDLTVAGKAYTLRLTTNGICELESRTKVTLGQVFVALRMVDFTKTRELLFQALQEHHAKDFGDLKRVGVLIDKAGGLLDDKSPVIVALSELFELMAPKDADTSDPLEAQAGTGDSSTVTLDALA